MGSNLDISALAGAPKAPGTPQRMPVRGVVVAAPADVTSPTVRVIAPAYSGDYAYDCRWLRQGNELPAVGADCLVTWDETGAGWVEWPATGPVTATGPAGGDLAGSYPNPTIVQSPQARVYNSANISIANGSAVALTFDSERYDIGGLHSTSSNTSRLAAPTDGLYSIGVNIEWASSASGNRQVLFRVNNATLIAADLRAAISTTQQQLGTEYRLSAGDYVEVIVVQTSGGALNVLADPALSPEFFMTRLSR